MNPDQLLPIVLPIVLEAGQIIKDQWFKPRNVSHKGRTDLVTETDKAVEQFLRQRLGVVAPEAGFLGEESASGFDMPADCEYFWVVDPVDGTTNFVHSVPIVGVSVALCRNGRPVLGIIDVPQMGEHFYAINGGGAFQNGEAIGVSDTVDLSGCLVATGFPYEVEPQLANILARLGSILPATQGLRRPGAASVDLAWVACGRLDAFYEDGLKPWDMAAGWLIVEEAGGTVTDFYGSRAGFGKSLLATNGQVHAGMVELLKI